MRLHLGLAISYVVVYFIIYWIHYRDLNVAKIILEEQSGLRSLDTIRAWQNLQYITSVPHPYNSRRIHHVRNYIVSIVLDIAKNSTQKVDVVFDNTTQVRDGNAFFECMNVIVRIQGNSKSAILVDAHVDAVPTSFGATDNGISVVAALEIARALSRSSEIPRSSIIFNFNFGEEDHLWGARCFRKHPWYDSVNGVVNLDGAGAGGREIVFGANDYNMMNAYRSFSPFPHATVIGNDFFQLGLIKSDVDFSIYRNDGKSGLSLAFYEPRSFYHTPYDDILHVSPSSLQHLMYNVYNLIIGFDASQTPKMEHFVFFDFLGYCVVLLSARQFLIANIIILVIGGITLGLYIWKDTKRTLYCFGYALSSVGIVLISILIFALFVNMINPFVIYGYKSIVWWTIFIFQAFMLQTFDYYWHQRNTSEPEETRYTELDFALGLTSVFWVLLLMSTIIAEAKGITSGYMFLVDEMAMLIYLGLGWVESFLTTRIEQSEVSSGERSPLLGRGGEFDSPAHEGESEQEELDIAMMSPLDESRFKQYDRVLHIHSIIPWLRLATILIPIILTLDLSFVITSSLFQTLADGTPPIAVYGLISVTIMVAILPGMPILLHRGDIGNNTMIFKATTILFVTFIIFIAFVNPFSVQNPLKVSYEQIWDMTTQRSIISLRGVEPYTMHISEHISETSVCTKLVQKFGLQECTWNALIPNISKDPPIWLGIVEQRNATIVVVNATESAYCIVDIKASNSFELIFGNEEPLMRNTSAQIKVYRRSFEPYEIAIKWTNDRVAYNGNVTASCYYSEWFDTNKQPTWDICMSRKPSWAIFTTEKAGLSKLSLMKNLSSHVGII